MIRRPRLGFAPLQGAVALAMVALLGLRPPAEGAMLVVPLGHAAESDLVNMTLDRGGRLLGRGPLPGSIVVSGRRALLEPSFQRVPAILLAAPAFACGAVA